MKTCIYAYKKPYFKDKDFTLVTTLAKPEC